MSLRSATGPAGPGGLDTPSCAGHSTNWSVECRQGLPSLVECRPQGGVSRPSPAGIGVDLVDIPQFAQVWQQPGSRFNQAFTPAERADIADRGGHPRHAAVRWAAKEAVVKAWSDSLHGEPPVMGDEALRQIETVTDAWGRPRLRFHAEVAVHLRGYDAHVSLSHDGAAAIAYVVLCHPPEMGPANY